MGVVRVRRTGSLSIHERGLAAYCKVVAEAVRNLAEGVGRTRGDEHDVGPAPEFDVQYRVADLVLALLGRLIIFASMCVEAPTYGPHSSLFLQTLTPVRSMSS